MKKIIIFLSLNMLLFMISVTLLADNPSSENYVLKAHALSSGSAISNAPSSANYILQGSVLGIITGDVGTSANYSLLPGYYLGIDETGELLPPTNVLIWITAGYVHMQWDDVISANSYMIYASDDPYAANWEEIATVGVLGYSEPISVEKKFDRVVASTEEIPVLRDTNPVQNLQE